MVLSKTWSMVEMVMTATCKCSAEVDGEEDDGWMDGVGSKILKIKVYTYIHRVFVSLALGVQEVHGNSPPPPPLSLVTPTPGHRIIRVVLKNQYQA